MPRGDQNAAPTVEQEMAKFTGFAQKDGETIPAEGENLNPTLDGAAATAKAGEKEAAKAVDTKTPAAAAKVEKLTDEESEAAISALDAKLGREATEDEIAAALVEAQAAKNPAAAAKPKATVADRIGKAVKAQRTAERRADALATENAALKARLVGGEKNDSKAPLTADAKDGKDATKTGEPNPKDFEFGDQDARFIRAQARYDAEQLIEAREAKSKETKLSSAQEEAKAKFTELKAVFEDTGTEKYPDFAEVVMEGARNKEWELSDSLGALLFESDHGPDIAYMLASDPKLAHKIAALPDLKQASWLGQQEARLSAGSGAKDEKDGKAGASEDAAKADATGQSKVSKAPAPIARARGQGSAASVSGDTNDFAAFEAAAMAQK
jgi:hypothetical protein